jgi:hypothetical protein
MSAAQLVINAVSTLAEAHPDRDNAAAKTERKWKRYLFYILGYCDTYHDFADARNTVGEGTSLKLGVKGSVRSDYVIDNIINTMDPSINFTEIYNVIKGDSTFEKSMYATFTDLVGNPLIGKLTEDYRQAITTHLSKIHNIPEGYSFQNIEIKDGDNFFSRPVTAPPAAAAAAGGGGPAEGIIPDSSIIELRIPAKVYTDAWQKNFIAFLHGLFPSCVLKGDNPTKDKLRIVEDTATFPRELFTSNPTNFERFQKLDIPQTRWDPAGLTNFNDKTMANLKREINNVSASSFRSLKSFSDTPDTLYPKNAAYFIQNTDIHSLILEGQVPNRIDNLQRGPSVNHLFMHLIVHSDLTPICSALRAETPTAIAAKSAQIKRDATRLINAANNPLKGKKSTTLKLIPPVAGQPANPELLRKYTTSKRTGDYENTNAAKYHNAVLFCGDEPEFVYAMLNEQPAIYHTHESAGHKFRINVSNSSAITPQQREARDNEQTVINYLHKAFEITRFFTAVRQFILDYFENIDTVFSKVIHFDFTTRPITPPDPEHTDLFKYIIRKVILSNRVTLSNLHASHTNFQELNTDIKKRLVSYGINEIKKEDYIRIKNTLLEKITNKTELLGIQTEIKNLDLDIKAIVKNVPRSLNISNTSATPNKAYLFREVEDDSCLLVTGESDLEQDTGWIIDSALFPILNSLNEIMPEIINHMNIISEFEKENKSRAVFFTINNRKKVINNILKGFGIEDRFFQKTAAAKKEAYTEAENQLNDFLKPFREPPAAVEGQGGGFTHAKHAKHAKHGKYTRRVKVNGKKHEHKVSRSRSKHRHTPKKSTHVDADALNKMSSTELYKYTKESIMKLAKGPFGLTGEEYANQIVFRMMIIDSIHEIIGKPSLEEEPVKVFNHLEQDISKNNPKELDLVTGPKITELVQSGGADVSAEESLVWYRIYIDNILPVWNTLHRNTDFSPVESIIISIIDGSFLELVMPLLEELSLINKGENDILNNIIEISFIILTKMNKLIDYSFDDKYYIFLPSKLTQTTTVLTSDDITQLTYFSEGDFFNSEGGSFHIKEIFLRKIPEYINFLGNLIQIGKKETVWVDANEEEFHSKLASISEIDTIDNYKTYMNANMEYMNNNIRYAFQAYFNLFYLDDGIFDDVNANEEGEGEGESSSAAAVSSSSQLLGGGAAPAEWATSSSSSFSQGGGRHVKGHERKKGKRRSSPRRLSIKNR